MFQNTFFITTVYGKKSFLSIESDSVILQRSADAVISQRSSYKDTVILAYLGPTFFINLQNMGRTNLGGAVPECRLVDTVLCKRGRFYIFCRLIFCIGLVVAV